MTRVDHQSQIISSLQTVRSTREKCAQDPAFALHLARLKRYQAERLKASYADLKAQARYSGAVDFFTDDLYGDRDFSGRDADLQRIVPTIAKIFPVDALATLDAALRLHALAETLDAQMCQHNSSAWREASYRDAWLKTGQAPLRYEQLALVQQVGVALDKLVKLPMIGLSLKAMTGPATIAGLTQLHDFLSRGYAAFKNLQGAKPFLSIIDERERALMNELFTANPED